MTRYRCVCPNCTAYITSAEEPIRANNIDAWEQWWEAWTAECQEYLASPCPHHGDGIEDIQEYQQYKERCV